jgi:hypothetical protein
MTKRTQMMIVLFAAVMVYAWGSTAIVRKWPDSPWWISGSMAVLLIAGIWVWAYGAARRAVPPDFKGGKWAAAVLVLGGDPAANNLTPTQRTVGSLILLGVVLTGLVLSLVWPDRPGWVHWAQTCLMLAVVSFLVLKAARKPTR